MNGASYTCMEVPEWSSGTPEHEQSAPGSLTCGTRLHRQSSRKARKQASRLTKKSEGSAAYASGKNIRVGYVHAQGYEHPSERLRSNGRATQLPFHPTCCRHRHSPLTMRDKEKENIIKASHSVRSGTLLENEKKSIQNSFGSGASSVDPTTKQ